MHWGVCCSVGVGAGAGCGAAAAPRISSLDAASAHRGTTTRHDAGDATFFYHPTRRRTYAAIQASSVNSTIHPSTATPARELRTGPHLHSRTNGMDHSPLEYIYRATRSISSFFLLSRGEQTRKKKWIRTILRMSRNSVYVAIAVGGVVGFALSPL